MQLEPFIKTGGALLLTLSGLAGCTAPLPTWEENRTSTATPATFFLHLHPNSNLFVFDTTPPPANFTITDAQGGLLADSPCAAPPLRQAQTCDGWMAALTDDYYSGSAASPKPAQTALDAWIGKSSVLHWFVQTVNPAGRALPTGNAAPAVAPQLNVSAAVVATDAQGTGIAAAGTQSSDLAPTSPNHLTIEGRNVYDVAVPLAWSEALLRNGTRLQLHVSMHLANLACDAGTALLPNLVQVYSDRRHRPRLELTDDHPVRSEGLHAAFQNEVSLNVTESLRTPWACQAPQTVDANLQVRGSDGQVLVNQSRRTGFAPCEGLRPSVEWAYRHVSYADGPYEEFDGAPDDGTYTLQFTARIEPNNVTYTTRVPVVVNERKIQSVHGQEPDIWHESPAVGPLLLVGLLGASAWRRRP